MSSTFVGFQTLLTTIIRYKNALGSFYSNYDAHAVSFEVGRLSAKGGHAHVQVVPIPRSISADAIADFFISEGTRQGIDLDFEDASPASHIGDRGYFRVDLSNGKRLVHWLKDGVPFSVQFGRCVQSITVFQLYLMHRHC